MTGGLRSSRTKRAQILLCPSGADMMPKDGSRVDDLAELNSL